MRDGCAEPSGSDLTQGGAPLRHIRVIELTTAWAGPMAGRIMAFMGAEVIHIEPATRLDSWRHHKAVFNPRRFPDGVGGERPFNRASLFNSQNPNKLSLTLDLKKPQGSTILTELLKTADVLISNFLPGFLERAGFGYEQVCQYKPDIIVVEMPAYGRTGPMANSTALGPTMEMAAGMSAMIGYPGGGPVTTGPAYLDPIGGFNGAAAILTALYHRAITGHGQHVEMPQVEAAMNFIGPEMLHAIATGRDPERRGNHVSWAAPHDAFPAAGDNEWIAIAVTTDAEWEALCAVIDQPALPADPRFATLPERLRNQDALFEPIATWTRAQDKHEAAFALQAAGVPAAPVVNARDAAHSEYLAARGFFTELTHPEAGTHRYQGLPFHLSRTPGGQHRAAPCLGQDTHDILSRLLGMNEHEIAALDAAGTTAAVPVG
jgi:crotonobetainyl-CoA:carnitine CoA-transferase CaiB-like acyl-CoA transferase